MLIYKPKQHSKQQTVLHDSISQILKLLTKNSVWHVSGTKQQFFRTVFQEPKRQSSLASSNSQSVRAHVD